jgi:hypothetical protein
MSRAWPACSSSMHDTNCPLAVVCTRSPVKFFYCNRAKGSIRFRPYDLVVTARQKVSHCFLHLHWPAGGAFDHELDRRDAKSIPITQLTQLA